MSRQQGTLPATRALQAETETTVKAPRSSDSLMETMQAHLSAQDLAFAQFLTGHLLSEVAVDHHLRRRGKQTSSDSEFDSEDEDEDSVGLKESLLREVAAIMAFTRKTELENGKAPFSGDSRFRLRHDSRMKRRGKSKFGVPPQSLIATSSRRSVTQRPAVVAGEVSSPKTSVVAPKAEKHFSGLHGGLVECISDTYSHCCINEQNETVFGSGSLEKGFLTENCRWQTKLPKLRVDEQQEFQRALMRLAHLEKVIKQCSIVAPSPPLHQGVTVDSLPRDPETAADSRTCERCPETPSATEVPESSSLENEKTSLIKIEYDVPPWRTDLREREAKISKAIRDELPNTQVMRAYLRDALFTMGSRNIAQYEAGFPKDCVSYWASKCVKNKIELIQAALDKHTDKEGESESPTSIKNRAIRNVLLGSEADFLQRAASFKTAQLSLTGRHLYSAFLSAPLSRKSLPQNLHAEGRGIKDRTEVFLASPNFAPHRRRPCGPCLSQYLALWQGMSDDLGLQRPFEKVTKELTSHDPFETSADLLCAHCVNTILEFTDEAGDGARHARALAAKLELSFPFRGVQQLTRSRSRMASAAQRATHRLQQEFAQWVSLQLSRESSGITDEVDMYTALEGVGRKAAVRTDIVGHFPIASGRRVMFKRAKLWYDECCILRLPKPMQRHALSSNFIFAKAVVQKAEEEEAVANRPVSKRQRIQASSTRTSHRQPTVVRLCGIELHDEHLIERLNYLAISISYLTNTKVENEFVIPPGTVSRAAIYVTPSGRSEGKSFRVFVRRRPKGSAPHTILKGRRNALLRQMGLLRYELKYVARGWNKEPRPAHPDCDSDKRGEEGGAGGFISGSFYRVPYGTTADESLRLFLSKTPQKGSWANCQRDSRVDLVCDSDTASKIDIFIRADESQVVERIKELFLMVRRSVALQQVECLQACDKKANSQIAESHILAWLQHRWKCLKTEIECTSGCNDPQGCCECAAFNDPSYPVVASTMDEVYLQMDQIMGPGIAEWWRCALGIGPRDAAERSLVEAASLLWRNWVVYGTEANRCPDKRTPLLHFLQQELFSVDLGCLEAASDFTQCFAESWTAELAAAAAERLDFGDGADSSGDDGACDGKYM